MVVRTRRQAASSLAADMDITPPRRAGDPQKKAAPVKRSLFDAGEARRHDAAAATAGAGSPPEHQQQPVGQLSAPPTPKTVDRDRQASPSPAAPLSLHPALEPAMVVALQSWRGRLLALQPMVAVNDCALLGALALMRALADARPDLHDTLHGSLPHLLTYTAAALWVSSKAIGIRTSNPNRSLMSSACQIHPQALTDFELDLCASLSWDITHVLQASDLLQ